TRHRRIFVADDRRGHIWDWAWSMAQYETPQGVTVDRDHNKKENICMAKITLPLAVEQAVNTSRCAQVGLRLIEAGAVLRTLCPVIVLAAVCVLSADHVLAQSVLGNDASRPVSLIKRGVDVFSWLMIIVGVFGIGKGIMRGMRGGEGWAAPAGWGTAGLGFG